MYPETDIPPIEVTRELLSEAEKLVPEPFDVKYKRFVEEYGLSSELAKAILSNIRLDLFERLVRKYWGMVPPTIIASTIENTLKSLRGDGVPVENISDEHIEETIDLLARGAIAKEAIPEILAYLARNPESRAVDAIEKLGLKTISLDELDELVDKVLIEYRDRVLERREKAFGLVMGRVMAVVRGRVDGATVARVVREKLKRFLEENK